MARAYNLSDLVLRCQRRCDKEGDTQITEWKALISEVYAEMYQVVASTGDRKFESESTITANGASSYALPTDHLSTLAVSFVLDAAGRQRPLRRTEIQRRANWVGETGDAFEFALIAETIELYPTPTTGTYKHRYVPQAPDLSSAADLTSVDLVTADGEAFLIWGVAVLALSKVEGNVQLAMARQEAARERLAVWAAKRILTNAPRRVVDDDLDYDRLPGDRRW